MKCQPVSIRQPEVGALVAGTMTVLIRPVGRLATLRADDLLWVREPFHLPRAFAHHKPTVAAALGAAPEFTADHDQAWFARHAAELGPRRMAREMPKAWHRQHLRIAAIDRVQLHDVVDTELCAAGWTNRCAFEVRWDADAGLAGVSGSKSNCYAANPLVLRIAFARIARPIPGFDPDTDRTTARSRRAAPRPRPPEQAPSMRRFAVPDRTPCPRCDVRRDIGCSHYPLATEARS